MRGRGRLSAEARLAVVDIQPAIPGQHLAPPEDLTVEEAVDWHLIVDVLPSGWFRAEHMPLMRELVRHIGYSRQVALWLAELKDDPLKEASKLNRVRTLQWMHLLQSRTILTLATKLRLTPTSLAQARTFENGRKKKGADGARPWTDWGGRGQVDRTPLFRPGRGFDRASDEAGALAEN
jgi:hypothetical protein